MPGVLKKITNTTTVIANKTSTVQMPRRKMKFSTAIAAPGHASDEPRHQTLVAPLALRSQLGSWVECVPDAVPQHVQCHHRENDHDPGRDRHPRSRVQKLLAVI